VSFFEPQPPPPFTWEPQLAERDWEPPLWQRASEAVLPWVYPINAVVHRNDEFVIAVDHLSVYPNGFNIHSTVLHDPHREHDVGLMMHPLGSPRVGVRFANGQTGGRREVRGPGDIPMDDQGIPIEPYVAGAGGGGGPGSGWKFWVWVYPLPPDGPMEVFFSIPFARLEEASITLDGSAVRAAAPQAQVIWT